LNVPVAPEQHPLCKPSKAETWGKPNKTLINTESRIFLIP